MFGLFTAVFDGDARSLFALIPLVAGCTPLLAGCPAPEPGDVQVDPPPGLHARDRPVEAAPDAWIYVDCTQAGEGFSREYALLRAPATVYIGRAAMVPWIAPEATVDGDRWRFRIYTECTTEQGFDCPTGKYRIVEWNLDLAAGISKEARYNAPNLLPNAALETVESVSYSCRTKAAAETQIARLLSQAIPAPVVIDEAAVNLK